MASVERGVVRGSNKEGPGGDDRNNSFPAPGRRPRDRPSGQHARAAGDRRNGCIL